MAETTQEINSMIEKSAFLKHMGFELERHDEEELILKLMIRKQLHNTAQSLHGGVHAAMLDTVQALLIRSAYKAKVRAVNVNVHYIAPSSEGDVFARAAIIQRGYMTATAEAEILDQNHTLIAKGTGVYKIIRDE
ncbi:PaaI family thioesterase [Mesobacillus harenae]|uniref:PaaI family thioesterase n=1 Tax=Mesobacillus harenae TaxID=2213203 RepID=UPI0015806D5A|nr:PaaI family thioesterase [Mesobacillus harenae]